MAGGCLTHLGGTSSPLAGFLHVEACTSEPAMSYQRGSPHNRFHVPHELILRTTRGAARVEGKPSVQEDPVGRSCADRKHPGPAHSPLNHHVFCEAGDRLTTGSAAAAPACHRILPLKQDRRFPDTGGMTSALRKDRAEPAPRRIFVGARCWLRKTIFFSPRLQGTPFAKPEPRSWGPFLGKIKRSLSLPP